MLAPSEQPQSFATVSGAQRLDILRSAVEIHNLTHPDATPINLIKIEDLKQHMEETQEQEGRQILLVKVQQHYLAVDVLKNGDQKTCVVLDAANDPRSYAVMTELEEHGFTTYMATSMSDTVERNLQSDSCSCGLFALDHCIQLSYDDPIALHENVMIWSEDEGFSWDHLPVNYLWNIQSNSFLQEYAASHSAEMSREMPNGMSASNYLALGELRNEDGDTFNNAINQHVLAFAWQAHRIAAVDQAYAKNEILTEMQDKIDELREVGSIPPQTIQQLETLYHKFAQSTEDAVQYQIKDEFDQVVESLVIEESAAQRIHRFRGIMQAGRSTTSSATAAVELEEQSKDANVKDNSQGLF